MTIPSWYELVLLALAAFRVFWLLGWDTIFDGPRHLLVGLPWAWDAEADEAPPDGYRYRLAEFLECPYCLGFWVALAWWGAFEIDAHVTTIVAVPFAISALVPIVRRIAAD